MSISTVETSNSERAHIATRAVNLRATDSRYSGLPAYTAESMEALLKPKPKIKKQIDENWLLKKQACALSEEDSAILSHKDVDVAMNVLGRLSALPAGEISKDPGIKFPLKSVCSEHASYIPQFSFEFSHDHIFGKMDARSSLKSLRRLEKAIDSDYCTANL